MLSMAVTVKNRRLQVLVSRLLAEGEGEPGAGPSPPLRPPPSINAPRQGLGSGARPGAGRDRGASRAPHSRQPGSGEPAAHETQVAATEAGRRGGPCAAAERSGAPAGPRACLAHLSGCAAFLRRCRRLLPVSAAGSDLWNHHTSPARCCSAAAAAAPLRLSRCSLFPLREPPLQPPASAAPAGRHYALPPSRPPASPSSLRPPLPSPPRRRRRRHRRRRLLLRAPLVFIESKQASWRRAPSLSQRAPGPPPARQHPGRSLAAVAGRNHPAFGAGVAAARRGLGPAPHPRAEELWSGPARCGPCSRPPPSSFRPSLVSFCSRSPRSVPALALLFSPLCSAPPFFIYFFCLGWSTFFFFF
uniref:transcription initiation factor TFIID subunit 4-like n=1 Tax=Macaca mulatta TaxID=9544 RepID=UPI0010A21A21|nr:transcription initiation factor TFIID subunit 4-like [Macaca mulatta]